MKRIPLLIGVLLLLLALVSLPLMSSCAKSATTTPPSSTAPAPPPSSTAPAPPPSSTAPAPPPSTTTQAPPQTLKIGVITSVTGPFAPGLKSEYDAIKPTQDLLNQLGGITVNGQKYNIELDGQDDQSSPPSGLAAANRLIQDGVKFIVAPIFPPVDLAMLPVTTQAKVITMTPTTSDPTQFNKDNPYHFCGFMGAYYIPSEYDYLQKNYPQVKKVAFLAPDDPGMNVTIQMCIQEATKRGLTSVDQERYPDDTQDFAPVVTKILAQKPDGIDAIGGLAIWATGIINSAREQGFTGPIYCGNYGDPHLLVGMVKPQYATDFFEGCPDVLSDQMTPIVKQLRPMVEKTGSQFIFDSVMLLNATELILQGIQNAQSFDTDKVKAALEAETSANSVWGSATWSGADMGGINHMLKLDNYLVSRIMNGKVTFEIIPVK